MHEKQKTRCSLPHLMHRQSFPPRVTSGLLIELDVFLDFGSFHLPHLNGLLRRHGVAMKAALPTTEDASLTWIPNVNHPAQPQHG